jgi:hypothetical protein
MVRHRARFAGSPKGFFMGALAGLLALATPARAETEVDLALVLAVDVSYSMDLDEQALQRQGFAEAFRSPEVIDAIRRGFLGRIAVVYFEWAGAGDQRVAVPWTLLDGPEAIGAFAERVATTPTRRAQRTSISGAIDYGARLLAEGGFSAARRVIDVSGDGANNQGRAVTVAREAAIRAGITVNGLPIMLKAPGYFDVPNLDAYYRDCVIGGPGAFLVPARDRAQFREAIKTKILLEVAGLQPDATLQPAQDGGRADCMAGETQWQDRMRN